MADDPLQSDLTKAMLIAAAVLLAIMWFIAITVIVPGLVNLHNDGALVAAAFVAVGFTAAAVILGRQLWRAFHDGNNA